MSDSTDYWAAVSTDELSDRVSERFSTYTDEMNRTGRLALWRKSVRQYYGQDGTGGYANSSAVRFGGEQGELALLNVNHYRSLINATMSMVTSQRPAFKAMALSDDHEAARQVTLAENIWDYELDEGSIEVACHKAAELSCVLGEGWVFCGWDPNGGNVEFVQAVDEVVDEDGAVVEQSTRPVYEGALVVDSFGPDDVARDTSLPSLDDANWLILRKRANKWDLVALFPNLREQILSAESVLQPYESIYQSRGTYTPEKDTVYVYELFHKKTPALPNGRHAIIAGDALLTEGPMPYDEIPLYAITPSLEMGYAMGYSAWWDLLGLSEAYNSVISNLVTVADAGGVPNWLADRRQQVDVRDLEGRLQLVEYTGDGTSPPPGLLEGPKVDRNQIELAKIMQEVQQTLSGVSGTMRGTPDKQLESGAALALTSSLSLQYNSGFQRSYAHLLRRVGTAVIRRYQTFLKTERIVEIVGGDEEASVKSFKSDDLADIQRIKAEIGNPLLRTIAGKEQVARNLLEFFGDQITPSMYISFLSSGRLEAISRADIEEERGLREEDQRLIQGAPVKALITDNHMAHIKQHKALLARPDIRDNDQMAATVLMHIQQHVELATNADPALLALTGQRIPDIVMEEAMAHQVEQGTAPGQNIPQQGGPPPGPQGGPPPGPPQGPPPGPQGPPGPQMIGDTPAPDFVPGAVNMAGERTPNLPRLPVDPLSGQRVPG